MCVTAQPITAARRTLALRPDAFTADALAARGWASLTEAARACGLAPSTLARCVRGEVAPGPFVVAQLLDGTRAAFGDLFVVVDA